MLIVTLVFLVRDVRLDRIEAEQLARWPVQCQGLSFPECAAIFHEPQP
ncbi:hypothetical protein [Paracoccus nototheniae]|uniref:Uncharacterized protein n=1 Tax=Paracoccus nototheniae TaxID=2489002 RepID=A0ABW4DWQ7_9RHOB|nr:hypothetical protein [Paracoccus nototheniae]